MTNVESRRQKFSISVRAEREGSLVRVPVKEVHNEQLSQGEETECATKAVIEVRKCAVWKAAGELFLVRIQILTVNPSGQTITRTWRETIATAVEKLREDARALGELTNVIVDGISLNTLEVNSHYLQTALATALVVKAEGKIEDFNTLQELLEELTERV